MYVSDSSVRSDMWNRDFQCSCLKGDSDITISSSDLQHNPETKHGQKRSSFPHSSPASLACRPDCHLAAPRESFCRSLSAAYLCRNRRGAAAGPGGPTDGPWGPPGGVPLCGGPPGAGPLCAGPLSSGPPGEGPLYGDPPGESPPCGVVLPPFGPPRFAQLDFAWQRTNSIV